jgi:crotonobetainyl-CoA:carnitine CoA-transferase CaiB-like acyl-CoA transferase
MEQPLDGIRVLDLGQIYQGPYCGMILSFLGADVVKVERPGGETVRDRSPDGETPEVQLLNPSKRGITLNLKTEEGKQALRDLIEKTDVLVENFQSGKMAELGVGYEDLKEINPELVYGHGSGYGNEGPYTHFPAMDLTIQAMGGVMHTTGFSDSPPVKAGPAISDFIGGIHLATGIVSALFQRERTGEGQYVEVGMYDCIYPTLTSPLSAWTKQIDAPPRTGNQHSGVAIAPYNVYEVEDGYLAIICIAEHHWNVLTELMGRPELADEERFSSKSRRAEHVEEIDAIVREWLEGRHKDETVELLLEHNIPTAPVQTVEEIIEDPHLDHRGMLNYLPNKGEGREEIPVPGMPIKFPASEAPEVTDSPRVGEHTDEVLSEVAGYSEEQLADLRERNAF